MTVTSLTAKTLYSAMVIWSGSPSTNWTRQVVQRALPPQACSWSIPASTVRALTSRLPAGTSKVPTFSTVSFGMGGTPGWPWRGAPVIDTEAAMAEQPVAVVGCGIAQLDLEVPIGAPPERVWQALVRDVANWWRPDFYCLPNPREFILEAKAGGRGYEFNGEGAELLWFTVVAVEPPHALELVGHLTPRF